LSQPEKEQEISEQIFRAYDIRGIYGKDLTPKIAELLGKGLGSYIGVAKTVAVGRDVRVSGLQLRNAIVRGLISVGLKVVDLGMVTTPIFYWAIPQKGLDGGVMITASHNPPKWNGFKLCRENGMIIGQGSGMENIKEIILEKKFTQTEVRTKPQTYRPILSEYAKFILNKIKVEKKLEVVLDPGNGATAIIAPTLFKQAGCAVRVINEKPDGNFPSRGPEPKEETLHQLKTEVTKTGADFGVGYDGDGDRSVYVDDKGRVLLGDEISVIFSKALIKKKGDKVVIDVSCSLALEESIKQNNGTPIVERVGRPYMMGRTLEEGAVFGGERSGHFYFPEIFGIDDGIYASLKMAEILSSSNRKLSEIIDSLPKYHNDTFNVKCPDMHKFVVTKKTEALFAEKGYEILNIDGVKAYTGDGWILVRPSNTEPLIRVFVEGKTEEKLKRLMNLAKNLVENEVKKAS
jgi:phosphomannomutase/phosphoglucomutase